MHSRAHKHPRLRPRTHAANEVTPAIVSRKAKINGVYFLLAALSKKHELIWSRKTLAAGKLSDQVTAPVGARP